MASLQNYTTAIHGQQTPLLMEDCKVLLAPQCEIACHKFFRPCQSSKKSFLCPLIQLALHKAVLPQCDEECTQQQLHLDFPAQCSDFDWDADDHCKREDISPMLFRPGHPESPVGLDFDHEKASLGKFI